jgi:hypothetical protein
MTVEVQNGEQRVIDGQRRVFYYGYWIKAYEVPADTLTAKKRLIEALTRRLFNHVEHGLNVPGNRLDEARHAYDSEIDPERKRVKGAMLAGALFNRAADIFRHMVELQRAGCHIQHDNALMRECGEHLQEALALGKLARHRSGEEGIDELWGEPFKAFSFSIEDFYKSRYVKIAMTMGAIDRIAEEIGRTFERDALFRGIEPLVREFAAAAKSKCETLRTDPDIFDVWTSFVVSGERLIEFEPKLPSSPTDAVFAHAKQAAVLIRAGRDLVFSVTRARVPMPKSTREFVERCEAFAAAAPSVVGVDRNVA